MRLLRLAVALTAFMAIVTLAAPAKAATISFNPITGSWSNALPLGIATITDNGTANPKARWGTGASGPSGYDFQAATPPVSVVAPPTPSLLFDLGTFTHFNNPIVDASISGIRLTVSTGVAVDGLSQGTKNFIFDFNHLETPNQVSPCANGGANNVPGPNVNGCADRVTFNYNSLSDSFSVGGILYTMVLGGFVNEDNEQVLQFWTKENQTNQARLLGVILTREEAFPTPEPATLVMLGAGLLGLSAATRNRRRRRR